MLFSSGHFSKCSSPHFKTKREGKPCSAFLLSFFSFLLNFQDPSNKKWEFGANNAAMSSISNVLLRQLDCSQSVSVCRQVGRQHLFLLQQHPRVMHFSCHHLHWQPFITTSVTCSNFPRAFPHLHSSLELFLHIKLHSPQSSAALKSSLSREHWGKAELQG